ncbi:MAG: regulatory protein RecX [Microbacterium gubbeenense]
MSDDAHGGEEKLAPVVPLFGGPVPSAPPPADPEQADGPSDENSWHTTWNAQPARPISADAPMVGDAPSSESSSGAEPSGDDSDDAELLRRAEARLTRSIASRGLSEREARDRLRRDGVDPHDVDEITERLSAAGALDDDVVAEQIVYQSVTRKNQGRRAVEQTLSTRGISREAIDRALESLPDDDYERALEFARGKASSLARLDRDTALRRLVGQLSRRGYGGSLAMSVAKQALDETGSGGTSRVRFR